MTRFAPHRDLPFIAWGKKFSVAVPYERGTPVSRVQSGERADIDGGALVKPFSVEGVMFLPLKTQKLGTVRLPCVWDLCLHIFTYIYINTH